MYVCGHADLDAVHDADQAVVTDGDLLIMLAELYATLLDGLHRGRLLGHCVAVQRDTAWGHSL